MAAALRKVAVTFAEVPDGKTTSQVLAVMVMMVMALMGTPLGTRLHPTVVMGL